MKKLILTTCLTLLLSTANASVFTDGNSLHRRMTSGNHGDIMYAMGYVVGVVDTGNRFLFCIPNNSTVGQLHDMVRNYLTNVPAERHLGADVIVTRVLAASFPCAKGNGV
jgi:hypothetical protein